MFSGGGLFQQWSQPPKGRSETADRLLYVVSGMPLHIASKFLFNSAHLVGIIEGIHTA